MQTEFPAHYAVINLVIGGPGPQITFAGGLENFAAMQAPDTPLQAVMVEVYGAEEAQ